MSERAKTFTHQLPWTQAQRTALALVMLVVLVFLAIRFMLNTSPIPNPQQGDGTRSREIQSKLDPNQASWQDLAALPDIGKSIAQHIVEEREEFRGSHPGQLPYESLEDLKRVKGVGEVTAARLAPYLLFPNENPSATTQP